VSCAPPFEHLGQVVAQAADLGTFGQFSR